jgi:homoserine O-succinyltransferase
MGTHALKTGARAETGACNRVVIAFVNNMPDAAIRSSERQFRGLLQAGARDLEVVLQGYYCPKVPRSEIVKSAFLQPYREVDELWNSQIDGLIVTGAEPHADHIADEPVWPLCSRLIDWAEERTASTIWSCLAAHAAVYKMSGITRRPLKSKLSGLFQCAKANGHFLTDGAPESWFVPQSRYNGLQEDELIAHGFQPLTRIEAGFDIFFKQNKSLFVFFQGHPEYDSETLLLEYIRDVKRFIEGDSYTYPHPPDSYFDRDMLQKLEDLRAQALRLRRPEVFDAVTRLLQGHQISNLWRSPSTIIFQNWLNYLARKKAGM